MKVFEGWGKRGCDEEQKEKKRQNRMMIQIVERKIEDNTNFTC